MHALNVDAFYSDHGSVFKIFPELLVIDLTKILEICAHVFIVHILLHDLYSNSIANESFEVKRRKMREKEICREIVSFQLLLIAH